MGELVVGFAVIAFLLVARKRAWAEQGSYYDSFEDGIPDYFSATRKESLSLCTRHYKQGRNSLRWDWLKGEGLVVRHGIGDVSRTGGFGSKAGFSLWLYMEAPSPDALVFEFREGETVTGFFRFPLSFTGWRQARPHYSKFPHGNPTSSVDNIRISAIDESASGTVFLDFLKYNTLTYSNNSIDPEKESLWRSPEPDETRFPKPDRVTQAELAGIRTLLGPAEGNGVGQTQVEAICERVVALGIERDTQGVRGPGIDAYYQFHPSAKEQAALGSGYWSDENGPGWMGLQSPGAMASLALEVASAYRQSNNGEQRVQLSESFLLIADHLHDQALQAGSGFKWNWWVGGSWAEALFLMRDLLAEKDRLKCHLDFQMYTYGGEVVFKAGEVLSHMDFYHLTVPCLFRNCLMQVEPVEQVRWLNAFQEMLQKSILQPKSALKIDGSAYHHSGHYHSYAQNAFGTLPPLFFRLNNTPWRLSAEVHERVRRAVLAQRIYCNRLDLPLPLSGRSPFRSGYGVIHPRTLDGLEVLARCGLPDGTQDIDAEVAAAYLRLEPESAKGDSFRTAGISPEPEPNGTVVMPYAGLLCHRRSDWLATVHGQSKYIWGTERQDHHNRYGLFQGLGHLEILAGGTPVTAVASGRQGDGWDWRRYEGTTVPQVTLEMLEEGGRGVGRSYSSETFLGGLSFQGQQGLFSMVVSQQMPGEKTLQGRKSWFFNDDQILCLGSDISCDEPDYSCQTTLCQKALEKHASGEFPKTIIDDEDFTAFPEERPLSASDGHWFLDVQETGYYVPAGQVLTVARIHQESRESWDEGDTEGDFLTAWLDHGRDPGDARYEYLMVVRADADRMSECAARPRYRVIRCDREAHIVRFGGRWGYVFFAPQEVDPFPGDTVSVPIKAVDRPCLIMTDEVQSGRLSLSLSDPDLNLEDEVNIPRKLRLTLNGTWGLVEVQGRVGERDLPDVVEDVKIQPGGAGETVVEILCRHGASYDLSLMAS